MSSITWVQFNLNLLTTLDALLDEGTVMGAAARLHLSQPAVSRALGRLRLLTGDEILVRSGRTMTPTPYATAIQKQVHFLVQSASQLLNSERELNLATLDRTFTIRSHDLFTGVLASSLLAAAERSAPALRFRFVAESPTDSRELARGRVDLELGGTVPIGPEISHEIIGTGTVGIAMRAGHPLASGRLTPASYSAARHVVVSRRGRLHDQIDDALAALGLSRQVVAVVPTSIDALRIVQQTGAVTAVPTQASRLLMDDLGLIARDLPLNLSPTLAISSWHQRYESDPAHQWLRDQVRKSFTDAFTIQNNR